MVGCWVVRSSLSTHDAISSATEKPRAVGTLLLSFAAAMHLCQTHPDTFSVGIASRQTSFIANGVKYPLIALPNPPTMTALGVLVWSVPSAESYSTVDTCPILPSGDTQLSGGCNSARLVQRA